MLFIFLEVTDKARGYCTNTVVNRSLTGGDIPKTLQYSIYVVKDLDCVQNKLSVTLGLDIIDKEVFSNCMMFKSDGLILLSCEVTSGWVLYLRDYPV